MAPSSPIRGSCRGGPRPSGRDPDGEGAVGLGGWSPSRRWPRIRAMATVQGRPIGRSYRPKAGLVDGPRRRGSRYLPGPLMRTSEKRDRVVSAAQAVPPRQAPGSIGHRSPNDADLEPLQEFMSHRVGMRTPETSQMSAGSEIARDHQPQDLRVRRLARSFRWSPFCRAIGQRCNDLCSCPCRRCTRRPRALPSCSAIGPGGTLPPDPQCRGVVRLSGASVPLTTCWATSRMGSFLSWE